MNIADIVFLGFAAITVLGAFIAVWPHNVFHNALGLILSLLGVAALFIFLNCEFLAIVEVIIYIGAISVAIIFAIMLSRPWFHVKSPRNRLKVLRSCLTAALLFGSLYQISRVTVWPSASTDGDFSIRLIGKQLLTTYALPFEVVSLVLLVAIIGTLVISGSKEANS